MFRVANARASHIVDAGLKITAMVDEVSSEGESMRRLFDLKLVRDNSPMFILSWLVMHVIDQDSPIYGLTVDDITERKVTFIISLTGIDDWSAQVVHANHFYRTEEVKFDHRFVDIIATNDGIVEMDYSKFHDIAPLK